MVFRAADSFFFKAFLIENLQLPSFAINFLEFHFLPGILNCFFEAAVSCSKTSFETTTTPPESLNFLENFSVNFFRNFPCTVITLRALEEVELYESFSKIFGQGFLCP